MAIALTPAAGSATAYAADFAEFAPTPVADAGRLQRPLRLNLEIPAVVAGAGLWFGSEALKTRLAPASCRWCWTDEFDYDARRQLRWDQPTNAWTASNVAAFGAVPVVSLGMLVAMSGKSGIAREIEDTTMAAEGIVVAALLSQAVKFAVGRVRPYAWAARRDSDPEFLPGSDDNLSFYSGHTSFAFSAVASSASVAELRGYESAKWIWVAGIPLAAAAGYFRIAGDKHWANDVIVGGGVGMVVGYWVPRLLHWPAPASGEDPRARSRLPYWMRRSWNSVLGPVLASFALSTTVALTWSSLKRV